MSRLAAALTCRHLCGAVLAVLLTLTACSSADTERLPEDPSLRDLALLLRAAAGGDSPAEGQHSHLDERLQDLLSPVEDSLPGSRLTLESSRRDGVLFFAFALRDAGSEPVLGLHLFYRPDLSAVVREGYGDRSFADYPAMSMSGEQIFLLVGRFEIRAFQRAEEFRDDDRMRKFVGLLPLNEMAQL